MDNLDTELRRLRKMRNELQEELEKKDRKEYRKLTVVAGLTGLFASLVSLLGTITIPNIEWSGLTITAVIAVVLAALIVVFYVQAHRSILGVGGYLGIEKRLLINEMPNIFQILSLLGFLNVLLQQQWIKITVTVIITFLLLIYLTSKRQEMIYQTLDQKKNSTANVTVFLSIILGIIIGFAVYGLASLISVQVKP
jgi:sugar phosphate permease